MVEEKTRRMTFSYKRNVLSVLIMLCSVDVAAFDTSVNFDILANIGMDAESSIGQRFSKELIMKSSCL